MNDIDAFVGCHGRKAMHRVNLRIYVSEAPKDARCFTRVGDDLLLCDSCTEFWLEHQGLRDLATLEKAVQMRESKASSTNREGVVCQFETRQVLLSLRRRQEEAVL